MKPPAAVAALPDAARRNKLAIAGVAVAGVVALALARRMSGGGGAGGDGTVTYAGRGGVYDSTANDVYNALEDPIFRMSQQLADLQAQIDLFERLGQTTPRTNTPGAYPGGFTNERGERVISSRTGPFDPNGPWPTIPGGKVIGRRR